MASQLHGQKDHALNTGRIAYGHDGTNAYPLLVNSSGLITEPLDVVEVTHHPFGKGALTIGGAQYGTPVTGITHAAYTLVDSATITQPSGYTLYEIEFGLTGATQSSGATKYAKHKWQGSDAGTSWTDLCAENTHAADASAYADYTHAGRFALSANFLGTSATFVIRMVALAEDATETVNAKAKNSSYIVCRYRR